MKFSDDVEADCSYQVCYNLSVPTFGSYLRLHKTPNWPHIKFLMWKSKSQVARLR